MRWGKFNKTCTVEKKRILKNMFKFVIIYLIIISNVFSYSSKYSSVYSNMNSYISQINLFNKVVGSKNGFLRLLSDVNKYSK